MQIRFSLPYTMEKNLGRPKFFFSSIIPMKLCFFKVNYIILLLPLIYLKFPIVDETGSTIAKVSS